MSVLAHCRFSLCPSLSLEWFCRPSFGPDGWRLTAWVAGLVHALLEVVSLIYPVTSSLSPPWALAAIAWGIGFVVAAERVRSGEVRVPFGAGQREGDLA